MINAPKTHYHIVKDTNGLDGLHWMLISYGAHATTTSVLVCLQLNLNDVASDSEDLFHLRLVHLVVQLAQQSDQTRQLCRGYM